MEATPTHTDEKLDSANSSLQENMNKDKNININKYVAAVLVAVLVIPISTYFLFFNNNYKKDQNLETTTNQQSYNKQSDTENKNRNEQKLNEEKTQDPQNQDEVQQEITLKEIPNKKVIWGGKQVFQTFNNCGPASLSMGLSYYNISATQQQLGNELRPYQNQQGDNDDKSVTLIEMAEKAKEYGFVTYHRPQGDIEMMQKFITYDIPVITRTWLKPNEDIGHYRVVKGFNRNKDTLVQDDSLQGRNLTYSHENFNELWQAFNYEFLVLVPQDKQDEAEKILGERLNKQKAWELALQKAEKQKINNPNDTYAKFNQATAHYYLGNYQQTVDIYEQIKNEVPRRMLWYQIQPILAHYQLKNYDKVMEMSQQIFDSENMAFSELHFLRAKIYELKGQENLAQKEYDLAEKYNSTEYWKVNLETLGFEDN